MKFVFALLALACAAMATEVFLNSDNIYNIRADYKMLQEIAVLLRNKGYTVKIGGIGPDVHYNQLPEVPRGGIFFTIFGKADAGTLLEMYNSTYSSYYTHILETRNAKMVVGYLSPPSKNIHNLAWLPRDTTDHRSPAWFKGCAWPEKKMLDAGYGIAIGANPAEMVDHFPGFKNSSYTEEVSPVEDISKAVEEVCQLTRKISYSDRCQTASCVMQYHSGDCQGLSDYIACELKVRGVKSKILQYSTPSSSNHRSVKYMDAAGSWVRYPYRSCTTNMKFWDSAAVENGREVAKTC